MSIVRPTFTQGEILLSWSRRAVSVPTFAHRYSPCLRVVRLAQSVIANSTVICNFSQVGSRNSRLNLRQLFRSHRRRQLAIVALSLGEHLD